MIHVLKLKKKKKKFFFKVAFNYLNMLLFSEKNLSSEGVGIFGSMTERQSSLLGALIRFAASYNLVVKPDVTQEHCIKLLSCEFIFLFLQNNSKIFYKFISDPLQPSWSSLTLFPCVYSFY